MVIEHTIEKLIKKSLGRPMHPLCIHKTMLKFTHVVPSWNDEYFISYLPNDECRFNFYNKFPNQTQKTRHFSCSNSEKPLLKKFDLSFWIHSSLSKMAIIEITILKRSEYTEYTECLSSHWFLRIQPKKGEETSMTEISIFDKRYSVKR